MKRCLEIIINVVFCKLYVQRSYITSDMLKISYHLHNAFLSIKDNVLIQVYFNLQL